MTRTKYDIIVIGGGSAGLVVASGAAGLGAKVALIERHKMGGDCLNYGCIPSKAFLKAAHSAHEAQHSQNLGLTISVNKTDLKSVMNRVKAVIAEIEPHDSIERYESLGVDVIEGTAQLASSNSVNVNKHELQSKHIVIATGSEAAIPPIPGLDTVPFMTNKSFFEQDSMPEHLIVLGAGPIGLELGQGMAHLGSKVTIVDGANSIFQKDDPEVAPLMTQVFKSDGISLELDATINSVTQDSQNKLTVTITQNGHKTHITGDRILVSLGRRPVTTGLNLESVGVKLTERGTIQTNSKLQTAVPTIWACGDVVGPYQFTHMAGYQAGIVIRNILFPLFPAKVDYRRVPWVTYTKPEVAHVGYTQSEAESANLYTSHQFIDLNSIDRAKTDQDRYGFLKLIIGKKKRIIGATLVGNKAGEMLGIAGLAIEQKLTATAFLKQIIAYPTESDIFKSASLNTAKASLKPWMKWVIKRLFL